MVNCSPSISLTDPGARKKCTGSSSILEVAWYCRGKDGRGGLDVTGCSKGEMEESKEDSGASSQEEEKDKFIIDSSSFRRSVFYCKQTAGVNSTKVSKDCIHCQVSLRLLILVNKGFWRLYTS